MNGEWSDTDYRLLEKQNESPKDPNRAGMFKVHASFLQPWSTFVMSTTLPPPILEAMIKLSDEVTVRMKYPSVDIMGTFKSDVDGVFDMMRSSIHEIYFKEELFSVEDHSKEEIDDFLNSLNSNQFAKLRDFFETMPKVKHDIKWVCEKCGEEVTQTVEGVGSFFGSA